jgi:Uma2 family endonuclease
MVIEVADTTVARDRGIKLRGYARAGIAVYWIVNLIDRTVEIYTAPKVDLDEPTYGVRADRKESDAVEVVLDGMMVGQIKVRDLLP